MTEKTTEEGAFKKAWQWVKGIHWSGVIIEEGALSIGRVMAWAVFGLLYFKWLKDMPVQSTLVEAFWGLLIYNGGKKVTGPLRDYLVTRKKDAGSDTAGPDTAKGGKDVVTVIDQPFDS